MADFKTLNGYFVKDEEARNKIVEVEGALRGEIAGAEEALRGEIAGAEEALRGEIAGAENALRGEIAGAEEALRGEIAGAEEALREEFRANDETVLLFPYRGEIDHGDCTIIKTPEKTVMIDVGLPESPEDIIEFMKNNGIDKLDYLIISHYHEDHIGGVSGQGVKALIESAEIDTSNLIVVLPHGNILTSRLINCSEVIDAKEILELYMTTNGIDTMKPEEGEAIQLDENNLIRFYNLKSEYFEGYYNHTVDYKHDVTESTNYNNFCMCAELETFGKTVFFSSDLEELGQRNVASVLGSIDVYKIEHHGINPWTDPEYRRKINADFAICMDRNTAHNVRYVSETADWLQRNGCKIYTQTESGNIQVTITKNNIGVESENGMLENDSYILSAGIRLEEGTDLDEIVEPGVYYSPDLTTTQSLYNRPGTINCGFKMIVEKVTHVRGMIQQRYIAGNTAKYVEVIRKKRGTEEAWDPYHTYIKSEASVTKDASTPAEGVTLTDCNIYHKLGIAQIRIRVKLASEVNEGDVTNVHLGSLRAYWPVMEAVLSSGATGPIVGGVIGTTGEVYLTATATGLEAGKDITLCGTYIMKAGD